MRKIKLDVDGLRVDSFEVENGGGDGSGTVQGNVRDPEYRDTGDTGTGGGGGTSGSTYFSCTTPYPTNENTCQGSCYGTCNTCANTCGSTCAVYPALCA